MLLPSLAWHVVVFVFRPRDTLEAMEPEDRLAPPLFSVYCPSCGYDLTSLLLGVWVTCPECGRQTSATRLRSRRPPPRVLRVVVWLALPFLAVIVIQAGFALASVVFDWQTPVLAAVVELLLPSAAALIGIALSNAYWSRVSYGPNPRRYKTATILVLLSGTLALVVSTALTFFILITDGA